MNRVPPGRPRAINDEIAGLLAAYQAELPGKLRALGEALRAARASPDNGSLREAARNQAHTIRGAAGCHGAPAVGWQAGLIEDLLVAMGGATQGGDPSGGWAEVDRALEQAIAVTQGQLPAA